MFSLVCCFVFVFLPYCISPFVFLFFFLCKFVCASFVFTLCFLAWLSFLLFPFLHAFSSIYIKPCSFFPFFHFIFPAFSLFPSYIFILIVSFVNSVLFHFLSCLLSLIIYSLSFLFLFCSLILSHLVYKSTIVLTLPNSNLFQAR